ncbi:MAG: head-tail adaptor protein [Cohaesibacter sp.]|jgi:head-tail adaptor|nr:head-tail adaptor protein [Cohaesibacter sp.]
MKAFCCDPGHLRHQIAIRRPIHDESKPWLEANGETLVATVWAAIKPLSSTESAKGDHLSDVPRFEVIIRYRDDLTGQLTLLHEGERLRVTSISDPDLRKTWLRLVASRELGQKE